MTCFRKLLLWSLVGVTAAMLFLGGAFRLAETHSPPVGLASECPAFEGNTCTDCIRQVRMRPMHAVSCFLSLPIVPAALQRGLTACHLRVRSTTSILRKVEALCQKLSALTHHTRGEGTPGVATITAHCRGATSAAL